MVYEEFSVYWWDSDGKWTRAASFVSVEEAGKVAKRLIQSIGSQIGVVRRVIITDGGDFTVLEWIFGKGIVYPTEEMRVDVRRAATLET